MGTLFKQIYKVQVHHIFIIISGVTSLIVLCNIEIVVIVQLFTNYLFHS